MPDNASSRVSEEAQALQEQKRKERQTYRARFLRILVFYPLAWIIAMRVPGDIRKMCGSLRKVLAFADLVGQDLSVEMATDILSHLGTEQAA